MARGEFSPNYDPILTQAVLSLVKRNTLFEKLAPAIPVKVPDAVLPRNIVPPKKNLNIKTRPGENAPILKQVGDFVVYHADFRKAREFADVGEDFKFGGEANHNKTKATWLTEQYKAVMENEFEGVLLSDSGQVEEVSGTDIWTDSSSDPITQINDAITTASKKLPVNSMALSYDAYTALKNNATFKDALKYTKGKSPNLQDIAEYFGLQNCFISDVVTADGYVISSLAVIAYIPPNPGLGIPSSFYRAENIPFHILVYREQETQDEGRWVEVKARVDFLQYYDKGYYVLHGIAG